MTDVLPWITSLLIVYSGGILPRRFLPGRTGRRPMLISSVLSYGVVIIVAGIMAASPPGVSKVSVNTIMRWLLIWHFSSGIMSRLMCIVWTEASPSHNYQLVLSISISFGFGLALPVTSASPNIQDKGSGKLGINIVYDPGHCTSEYVSLHSSKSLLWERFSIMVSIWSIPMVHETKTLSLEKIDYLYKQGALSIIGFLLAPLPCLLAKPIIKEFMGRLSSLTKFLFTLNCDQRV